MSTLQWGTSTCLKSLDIVCLSSEVTSQWLVATNMTRKTLAMIGFHQRSLGAVQLEQAKDFATLKFACDECLVDVCFGRQLSGSRS